MLNSYAKDNHENKGYIKEMLFILNTVASYDTSYSPDGENIIPGEDHTFSDADDAVN